MQAYGFSLTRILPQIEYRRIRVSENPYYRIFYAVSVLTPNIKCTKDNNSLTLKSKICLKSIVTYLSLHTFVHHQSPKHLLLPALFPNKTSIFSQNAHITSNN